MAVLTEIRCIWVRYIEVRYKELTGIRSIRVWMRVDSIGILVYMKLAAMREVCDVE